MELSGSCEDDDDDDCDNGLDDELEGEEGALAGLGWSVDDDVVSGAGVLLGELDDKEGGSEGM